uniref:Uncharacterized protein n=1 Tax=Glossina pallidipes TaxID=7398 RepID=A0A1B0ADA2_GLOPL
MREQSYNTTPRRRGPKQPLPHDVLYDEDVDLQESPYYTIDNTEDVYSTTLLPSQRCYVDPWDLENYDYVRKKIEQPSNMQKYYDESLPSSPMEDSMNSHYCNNEMNQKTRHSSPATLPRNRRRSSSSSAAHQQCRLECCNPVHVRRSSGLNRIRENNDAYDDYITQMNQRFENNITLDDDEANVYTGYGALSSTTSSSERHSSIGEDYGSNTIQRHSLSSYGALKRRTLKPAPQLEFPAPPPLPPTYDYCNPYATLPCCSVSDCYECLSQSQQVYGAQSIYGSIPTSTNISCYSSLGCGLNGGCSSIYSTLGRRSSSTLCNGIYGNKFGMSNKGLLQIDYSCSWNDLNRVMGRNY